MMKKRLLLIILFFCVAAQAQQKNQVTLNWTDNVKSSVGTTAVTIPQFQGEYMNYYPDSKELFFTMDVPVSLAVRENSLEITNAVYESVTATQLGELAISKLPGTLNAKLQSANARDAWYAVIRLSPILKEGGTYKRLKSFSFSYQQDNTKSGFSNKNTNIIANSVLASGEWHRFYVEKSGVYKLSRNFLQQMGVNVNADPRNIKIFGNGGRMLPLLNSTPYPLDLAENAITFIGEQDGVFNNEDYILFYAEGVDNWSAENGTHNNLYADRAYYYVTSQGGNGSRMGNMFQPSGAAVITTSLCDDYHFYEKDLINIARLGRKWHGEAFNVNNEQTFEFSLPDVEPSVPVKITVSAAAKAPVASSMGVKVNGGATGSFTFPVAGQYSEASDGSFTGTFTTGNSDVNVVLTYNNGGAPGSNAWLDYIILQSKRRLRGNGQQYRFQYNEAALNTGVIEYQFSNAGTINEVWDITDIYNVSKTVNQGNQGSFTVRAGMGELRKFIAVSSTDYYTPLKESNAKVANQNIKGSIFNNSQGQFQDIDYIIVTPAFLSSRAERLANYHRTQSQLNVKVVKLENIYQEFSSGKQDIGAIRNFIKYVYNNASSNDRRIKYLNLFGDASFDFKDRIPNNTNIVPTLHAYDPAGLPNYSLTSTFVSDDFFGLMDANEGRMLVADSDKLDIAVGRMLVNSEQQADEMVNKVLEYTGAEAYGRWRNEYLLISDDLDNNGEQFVDTLENIANDLVTGRPFINVRKIHSDSFLQEASAGGQRYPEARRQIINTINYGTLVVNYLGHGGEEGIASERLLTRSDAQNLTNRFKYPLFITATCELTKFDNPYRQTAGEDIYWNPKGGAIAMITTTRSIYISEAFNISPRISDRLFALAVGDAGYPSMAEALRQAKVLSSNNSRVIAFVGDPALKLAIPRPKVILTSINGVPLAESTDVLEALSFIKLGGQVTDENGTIINNYNGELAVTISDKQIQRNTLNNDNVGGNENIKQFTTLGETVFRGNASVSAGKFEFGFVVPRDIRIPVAAGRASFYAKRNNVLQDHTGYDLTIKVGGINENAAADNTAPRAKLYMNEETFVSGGITNDSPILLAILEDENGLNTASGIGHDMVAILDGDETNQYILNDYYETELDNYKKGRLRFPLANLEKGLHTLTVKAWDVYNNPVSAEIQFTVVGDDALQIDKVLNYPNPFVSYTEFWFNHNRPFEPLDVQVQIFTITGKVVKTINQQVVTDGFLCRDIKWDGRDDFGDKIGKGVYVYKLTVRSSATNKIAHKYEKLVLL